MLALRPDAGKQRVRRQLAGSLRGQLQLELDFGGHAFAALKVGCG
jgi:hypothetical protein